MEPEVEAQPESETIAAARPKHTKAFWEQLRNMVMMWRLRVPPVKQVEF